MSWIDWKKGQIISGEKEADVLQFLKKPVANVVYGESAVTITWSVASVGVAASQVANVRDDGQLAFLEENHTRLWTISYNELPLDKEYVLKIRTRSNIGVGQWSDPVAIKRPAPTPPMQPAPAIPVAPVPAPTVQPAPATPTPATTPTPQQPTQPAAVQRNNGTFKPIMKWVGAILVIITATGFALIISAFCWSAAATLFRGTGQQPVAAVQSPAPPHENPAPKEIPPVTLNLPKAIIGSEPRRTEFTLPPGYTARFSNFPSGGEDEYNINTWASDSDPRDVQQTPDPNDCQNSGGWVNDLSFLNKSDRDINFVITITYLGNGNPAAQ